MIRKNLKTFFSIIILLIVIIWLVFYVKNHLDDFRAIHIVSYFDFFVLVFLSLVYLVMQGLVLKITLDSFKINLRFREWFGLTLLTLIGNFLLGFGGLGFRAVYLKKKYSFNYSHFLSTTAFISLAIFFISALFGAGTVLLLFYYSKILNWEIISLYVFIITISLIIFFIPSLSFKTKNRILLSFNNLTKSWHIVKKDKKLVTQTFVLTFFEFLIFTGLFYFSFRTFGFEISFLKAFLPASLSLYSLYLSFVPAALGFYEAAVLYSSKIIGLTITQGLSVVFLTRIINIFWTCLLGVFFSYNLIKPFEKKEKNK